MIKILDMYCIRVATKLINYVLLTKFGLTAKFVSLFGEIHFLNSVLINYVFHVDIISCIRIQYLLILTDSENKGWSLLLLKIKNKVVLITTTTIP